MPADVLEKIYHTNFERVYGSAPLPLNTHVALNELERLAREFEALEKPDQDLPNQASQVAQELMGSKE